MISINRRSGQWKSAPLAAHMVVRRYGSRMLTAGVRRGTIHVLVRRAGVYRIEFLFLLTFACVCSCGRGPGSSLPASLSRFPSDLANPALSLTGIHEDGWIGE